MNFDWNIYLESLAIQNAAKVIAVRPSSQLRKEHNKKDKSRNSRCFDGANNVTFNDHLQKVIKDYKDYEEEPQKKILK